MVVYFDGVCGLCNRTVDRLLSMDRRGRLRFAPLQGETAARELGQEAAVSPSFIVTEGGRTYFRSDAVLAVCRGLGGWYGLLRVFWLVPRPLRNLLYDFIARRRYRWFGKLDACRLPTPEERGRFLP